MTGMNAAPSASSQRIPAACRVRRSHPHDVCQGRGRAVDAAALATPRARSRRESWPAGRAGIDLVNDGECRSRVCHYVKDRLAGWRLRQPFVFRTSRLSRAWKASVRRPGRSRRKTPACNAPIAVRDREAAAVDIADLKAALAAAGRSDAS